MITKQQHEEMVLMIKAKREQIRIMIQEQDLFIIENLLDESKAEEVAIASKTVAELEKLDAEYKEDLYELHHLYNSQYAKPVPTSIRG